MDDRFSRESELLMRRVKAARTKAELDAANAAFLAHSQERLHAMNEKTARRQGRVYAGRQLEMVRNGLVPTTKPTARHRAYSALTVKSIDNELREIYGLATSNVVDRVGDIVESLNAVFQNPTPLLWQHDHSKPIGTVTFDRPTATGLKFRAKIPVITEPGILRERTNEAWQSVKAGLVRGVSIGFRALDGAVDVLPTGGKHFKRVEILELSLCTVPANQQATIGTFKAVARAA
jgi:HK97 family phage prohead protease